MTQAKICGINDLQSAQCALDYGADYLGFMFYAKSSRAVSPEDVQRILDSLKGDIATVGVFVNAPLEEIEKAVSRLHLDYVQLHGDESLDFCRKISIPVIKALRINSVQDFEPWKSLDKVLLDACVQDVYGGSGSLANWDVAAACQKDYNGGLFLAGGLTALNVKQAIYKVNPYAVDVSSGVEAQPGQKDLKKIKQFLNEVKS